MQVKSRGGFYNHTVIWFEGAVVFAGLSRRMQVKSRVNVFIIIWSFGFKVKSYLQR